MAQATAGGIDYTGVREIDQGQNRALFWGCFIALITTAFGFITRMFLIGEWATEFNLDPAQAGRVGRNGIWPFAGSVIAVLRVIDRIGYKTAVGTSFLGCLVLSGTGR